jgi:iron complex outermembrane receptor protein
VWLKELRELFLLNPALAQEIVSGRYPDLNNLTQIEANLVEILVDRINGLGESAYQPICANVNQDYTDEQTSIEIHDSYILTNKLRAVSGINISRNMFKSKTYIGGSYDTYRYYVMTNFEYKPSNKYVINAGVVLEDEKRLKGGPFSSYRAGLNYHLNAKETLRIGYSEAIRTPDLLENNREWNYYGDNFNTQILGYNEGYLYFQSANEQELAPEEIREVDLGYMGTYAELGVNLDLKVFYSKLSNLISERIDYFNLNSLTNSTEAELYGLDLQVKYNPIYSIEIGSSYSFLESDTDGFYEKTLYSKHKGNLYIDYSYSPSTNVALAYYGTSTMNGSPFGRLEFLIRNNIPYGKSALGITFKISHHLHEQEYVVNPTFSVDNKYDSNTHYMLTLNYIR